jgi:DNA repair protein RecN (Recombination protein N)
LHQARVKAAAELEARMALALKALKFSECAFKIEICFHENGPIQEDGLDDVSFEVKTNPGLPFGPLYKIASGGELSRFMLAFKLCLAKKKPIPLFVFDEIDAGLGGPTAMAMARCLRQFSDSSQVISITHSPQIASFGHMHIQIEKQVNAQITHSRIHYLTFEQRCWEIARMIGGESPSSQAYAAAHALLDETNE